jgi:hypothetical protein
MAHHLVHLLHMAHHLADLQAIVDSADSLGRRGIKTSSSKVISLPLNKNNNKDGAELVDMEVVDTEPAVLRAISLLHPLLVRVA